MAKVELTGMECIDLIKAQEELEALKRSMVEAYDITLDEDTAQPRAYVSISLPKDVMMAIRTKVVDVLTKNPDSIKHLVEVCYPMFDTRNGIFTRDWGTANDPWHIDLRHEARFKKLWDQYLGIEEEA